MGRERNSPRILVIGIGNIYRGDDAAGLLAARQLKCELDGRIEVIEENGEGAALIEAWKGADSVFLIDAICSGADPGSVHRFNAKARPVPARFFRYSTHAFGVAEAIELARSLNQLPPRLTLYGVEGKSFQAGAHLSSKVKEAVLRVVESVRHDLEKLIQPET
jgi:hydrogenase maturation protease